MKRFLQILTVLLLVFSPVLISSGPAYAQEWSRLFEAVDALEANLKQLVENEATMRAIEIKKLAGEVQKLNSNKNLSDNSNLLKSIQEDLKALAEQVDQLKKRETEQGITASDYISLLNDIEYLKAENQYKKSLQEENQAQYVSIDPAMGLKPVKPIEENSSLDELSLSESSFGGLEFSGFVDFVAGRQSSLDDENNMGLGQAEIDIATEFSENASTEVAIAYNNETGNFELGSAVIDLHFSSSEGERHLPSNLNVNHSYILAGQFDVPFGIDYNFYPSSDRKLVTVPAIVDLSHGSWNDFGLQVGLEMPFGNFVGYWVNGFESSAQVLNDAQSLSLGVAVYEDVDTSPADAFGTRLGITPTDWLEFGGSFALGLNATSKSEMMIGGADLLATFGNLELKGEYIYNSVNKSIAPQDLQGYYLQTTYNTPWGFLVGRHGATQPQGEKLYSESSLGAGYIIDEGVEVRFEQVLNDNNNLNKTLLQLVAGF